MGQFPVVPASVLTCGGCGAEMPGDSSFCASCGRALNSAPSKAGARRWHRKPWLVVSAVFLAFFLVLLPGLLYVWAGLPSTSNLSTARLPLSTRIYDRTGTVLLAEIHQGSDRRHVVPISAIGRPSRRPPAASEAAASSSTAAAAFLARLR